MSIKHLPQHLINKLKAGEIVERPASIVKELIENALDAGADTLSVILQDAGSTLITIKDNGTGMSVDDLPLSITRYATSKIYSEQDLETIHSYGFRGEALAAIAEVSTCTIQTRHQSAPFGIGYELTRPGGEVVIKQIPFAGDHGTTIHISDLFAHVPARKKFLKSVATERYHIRQLLLNYLLIHRDKSWTVTHQNKVVWQFSPAESLLERTFALTNPQRQDHLLPFQGDIPGGSLMGLLADASLHFSRPEQLRFFVNGRPVEDKIIKKALMQAMQRQLPAGLYPFAYLFLEIDPALVDVNVHPRKSEVKFLDPGAIFQSVHHLIVAHTATQKVAYASFTKPAVQKQSSSAHLPPQRNMHTGGQKSSSPVDYRHGMSTSLFDQIQDDDDRVYIEEQPVEVIGQLWKTYILASSQEYLYLIDQHALAERITFEMMKSGIKQHGFTPTVLLSPIIIHLPSNDIPLENRIVLFTHIGMDASEFGEGKMIIHGLPQVFLDYGLDVQQMCQYLRGQQEHRLADGKDMDPYELFSLIIEEMIGMKACKASITAGQSLSFVEMYQLLRDGRRVIPQLFVCQHGRPSIVKFPKEHIDSLVER